MALLRQSAAAGWVSAREELQRVLGATRYPARGARGHAIGQRALARLRTEVEAVMKDLKFSTRRLNAVRAFG